MNPADTPNKQEKIIRDMISLFEESEFSRLLGMHIIEAWDGYAKVSMDCAGKGNDHNSVHGGAIFSLADQAFAIASNSSGIPHVAVSVSIQYIAPAKGPLVAVAKRIAKSADTDIFRVRIYEKEKIVATFDGTAFCTRSPGST